mgnify:CR=1 FL=1
MAEDSDLEKTEPASERRLSKAREEGNVPASRELGTFIVLISGVATLWAAGSWMSVKISAIMLHGLTLDRRQAFDIKQMTQMLHSLFSDGRLKQSLAEHRAILDALAHRDLARSEQLMREHISSGRQALAKVAARRDSAA